MLVLSLDEVLALRKCSVVDEIIPSLEYAKFPTFLGYTQ